MESGQATPQGSSPYRASLEQEKSPWKDSLQQVTVAEREGERLAFCEAV